jgi:hypothetical protein
VPDHPGANAQFVGDHQGSEEFPAAATAGQLSGSQHGRQGAGTRMAFDVAIAVVDIQGIAEKSVGQGGAGGRGPLAAHDDGGLIAAKLRQGGLANDAGNRRL